MANEVYEPNTPEALRTLLVMLDADAGVAAARDELKARDEVAWPAIRSTDDRRRADAELRSQDFGNGKLGGDVLLYVVARGIEEALSMVNHDKIKDEVAGPWAALVFRLFGIWDLKDPEDKIAILKKRAESSGKSWITHAQGPAQAAAELVALCSLGTPWKTSRAAIQDVGHQHRQDRSRDGLD